MGRARLIRQVQAAPDEGERDEARGQADEQHGLARARARARVRGRGRGRVGVRVRVRDRIRIGVGVRVVHEHPTLGGGLEHLGRGRG